MHDGPPALLGDATEGPGDRTPGKVVGEVYHLAERWIEPVSQILVGNPCSTELRLEEKPVRFSSASGSAGTGTALSFKTMVSPTRWKKDIVRFLVLN